MDRREDDLDSLRRLAHSPLLPDKIGRYQVESLLGRGGMGKVYRAYDPQLERVVAIKIIDNEAEINLQKKQILKEAKSAAQLRHNHIVQIYEIGDDGSRPYLVMEYVCGHTLADYLRSNRNPDYRWSLRLIRDVANAVHYAHRQGIIHRDLKPGNIMLDGAGHIKLMDFGLAKVLGTPTSTSTKGMMVGTAAYMPPEQVNAERVDKRSDVYALGAVLYEMLTGQPPFSGPTTLDIAMKILTSTPLPPRDINPAIPQEVELICSKCLHKKRQNRYASAQSLARDIERYLECRPIIARSGDTSYRLNKWARRNFSAQWPLLVLALLLVVLMATNCYLLHRLYFSPRLTGSPSPNSKDNAQSSPDKINVTLRTNAQRDLQRLRTSLRYLWKETSANSDFANINSTLMRLQKDSQKSHLLHEHRGRICFIYALKNRQRRQPRLLQAWHCFRACLALNPESCHTQFLTYQLLDFCQSHSLKNREMHDKWCQLRRLLAQRGAPYYHYFSAEKLSKNQSTATTPSSLKQGIAFCQRALQMQPDFAAARLLLAKFYRDSGDYNQAWESCGQALRLLAAVKNPVYPQGKSKETLYFLTPLYLEALTLQGWLAYKLDKNAIAAAILTQGLQYSPDAASLYLLRGKVFSNLKNYQKAIADFTTALEFQAAAADCYWLRAQAYGKIKNYTAAIADMRKVLPLLSQSEKKAATRQFATLLFAQKTQEILSRKKK